jgi:hypothetical protein
MNDEKIAQDFLLEQSLQAERIGKKKGNRSKSPDFRVFKDDRFVFFCEVKTINKDRWLDDLMASTSPGQIVGGGRDDPRYGRIANKIHEAVQQFKSVNPEWIHPNVLIFINHDDCCGPLDLIAVTSGYFLADNGSRHKIFGKFSDGRIKEEKFKIDLYIWLDSNKRKFYLFNFANKKHLRELCTLFSVKQSSIKEVY